MKSIVLFNSDLRINDNLALNIASENSEIIPVYIYDNKLQQLGDSSKVWLHYSLKSLNKSLNNKLIIKVGNIEEQINTIIDNEAVDSIYWNRVYEPKMIEAYKKLKTNLQTKGLIVKSFNSSLLTEPSSILKKDETPYKVYTPYYKQVISKTFRSLSLKSVNIKYANNCINSLNLENLNLLPKHSWYKKVISKWNISENGANELLNNFIDSNINKYKDKRDFPNIDNTSKLSAYLHFGLISPIQIINKVESLKEINIGIDTYIKQLIWREFSYYLLYHFNNIDTNNFNSKFDSFIWNDSHLLDNWKNAQTGIPIIDAGMTELYETGYMHNRVRMVVASFLTKNLLINWKEGLAYFNNTLFDADIANNSASWQWVAGTGADAAPYFRIFNPILQSEKFDKHGEYIRKYLPALKNIPNKYIHDPSKITNMEANIINFKKGIDYPYPIVDLKESRELALSRHKQLK